MCACVCVLNEGFVAAIIFVAPELLFVVLRRGRSRRRRTATFTPNDIA